VKNYDIIWIGTGQATGTVVPRLIKAGKKVAIIEGDRFGGSCVNYGCTPTKTLVASARVAHMARRAADFGININGFEIDFKKVMLRQNDIRNKSSIGLKSWLESMKGVDIFQGYAQFEDEHRVRIGDDVISGDAIVIHAGTRAQAPDIPGLDSIDWLDNAKLLDLEELPHHLVILGGSYIGLEFGHVFRRFGSEVTIIEKNDQLMFREDADVAEAALNILEKEGINVRFNSSIEHVSQTTDGVRIDIKQDGKETFLLGSHLLIATGRVPNTDRLNVEAAGVELNEQGYIPVNDVVQTNVSHIYAVGDVNGGGAFTHTSVNDGEIFWDYYSGEGDRAVSERNIVYAMYIDPPLGRVGMSEKVARQSGRNVLMAKRPMSRIARAVEKDETAGFIKLLVDADTEQFLGATILGVGGDEIINMIAAFMVTGQSYKTFRRAVLAHPTVAELLPWILDDLALLEK
jgi:pyruvate/2-oxoglutarate dehydrogenase complex dihydrolipoamide dehydrogenase (E3) component